MLLENYMNITHGGEGWKAVRKMIYFHHHAKRKKIE